MDGWDLGRWLYNLISFPYLLKPPFPFLSVSRNHFLGCRKFTRAGFLLIALARVLPTLCFCAVLLLDCRELEFCVVDGLS